MFNAELKAFRKNVEKEIYNFFRTTPDKLKEEMVELQKSAGNFIDLSTASLKNNISLHHKELLIKYETLAYFNSIYDKLIELETICSEDE